jgi:hypothetical protein
MTAQQPQREQPVPGELVYSGTPWKIYRQDAGMGEHDYIVLLNDVYFCRTEYSQTAHEIIRAVARPHTPAPSEDEIVKSITDAFDRGYKVGFLDGQKDGSDNEKLRASSTARAATLAARHDILKGKLEIIDSEIEKFHKPDLDTTGTAFLNGLLYARTRIFGSEQQSLRTQSTTAQERP